MKLSKLLLSASLIANLYAITQKEAIELYNKKEYNLAYTQLLKLLKQDNYQSNVLNYYFAKSAEKIGNYKEALGAIERILIQYPNDSLALFERAKLFFLLKNYSLSKRYFLQLKSSLKNKKTQNEIDKYLSAIKKQQKKNFLTVTAVVGMGYDSNINNTSSENRWNLYLGDGTLPVTNNQKIKHSYTLEETLLTNYKHRFENFTFDNNLLLLSKQYTASHSIDINYFKESPAIILESGKYLSTTRLNYGYLTYGDNYYLSIYGVEENFKYKISKNIINSTILKIDNKIYTQENTNKNATLYSIDNKTDKYYSNNRIGVLVGFAQNKRHKGNLSTINYKNYKMGIDDTFKFSSSLKLTSKLQYEYIKYRDRYEIFNTTQKDKRYTFLLSLTKKLQYFNVEGDYKFIKNDSNIAPFDYDKWSINLNLIKTIRGL